MQNFIPALDPNPVPGPFWLFKLLLTVTFLLHLLAMNMLLGSAVIAFFARLKRQDEMHRRLFENLKHKLPNLLPATITLGVAPLLFVQVLYGQFLYTSSIIMGWFWFSVIILLTIAYYGYYFVSFRKSEGKFQTPVLLLSVLLTLVIAFIYSNNMTLALHPEHWAAKYFADPAGFNLHLNEPSLIPRYLHFVVAALAIGGLFVALTGYLKRKKDPEFARFLIRHGGRYFMFATMAQVIVGIWFLMALPKEQMMLFMGKNKIASAFLVLGLILTILTIIMMSRKLKGDLLQVPVFSIGMVILVIMVMMIIMRDILRESYLSPYFKLEEISFIPQWGVLILFLILFVMGTGLWLWMLKKYPFQSMKKEGL